MKIKSKSSQLNKNVSNKLVVLQWTLRLYKDVKFKRIAALHTIEKCKKSTGSKLVVRDMDREIDVVCKYMPKLEQALDIKEDHVMSADHFNQDSIEINVNTEDSSDSSNADPKYSSKKDI